MSATPGGPVIDLNLDTTSGNKHALVPGFTKSSVSTVDHKTIDMGRRHDLLDSQAVVYYGEPNAVGPLSAGSVYFVKLVDDQKIQLSLTKGGPAITLNAAQASDKGHFLVPVTSATKDEIAPTRGLQTFKLENPLASLDTDGDSNGDGVNDGVADGKIDTRDKHIRAVTDTEYWTNLSLLVLADDNSDAYSGVGGITWGHSVGAGGSVAVNTILRETNALIGNLEIDLAPETSFAPGVGIDSEDAIYLGYNHGFVDGDRVTYAGGGDLEIGGLRDGETYYVNLGVDSDSSGDPVFTLSRTANEASATFNEGNIDTTNHVIDLGYAHGFQLGDLVRYQSGNSPVIGGLENGRDYLAIPVSATKLALAESSLDYNAEVQFVFDPVEVVKLDQLVFGFDHGFATGEAIRYTAGGGTAIGGLTSGNTYFVHVVNDKTIELRATAASQVAIVLGSVEGVGRSHTLQQGFVHSSNAITGATNGSSHTIDLGYWHGFQTGDPIRYSSAGSTITGLTNDTLYYAIVDGEQKIALATTNANAIKGQWQFFDAATAIKPSGNVSRIELSFDNNYALGDALVYSRNAFYTGPGIDPTTAITYTDADGNVGTLTEGTTYYAIPVFDPVVQNYDSETQTFSQLHLGVRLALSLADAQAGRAITLSGSPVGIHGFHHSASRIAIDAAKADNSAQFFATEKRVELSAPTSAGATHKIRLAADPTGTRDETHGLGKSITPTAATGVSFDPATAVSGNTITKASHGLATGDRVLYDDGETETTSATAIGGIYRGQVVYAIVTSASTLQLATTPAEARAGTAITLDASKATGTNHQLRKTSIDHVSAVHLGYTHGLKTGDAVVYSNGRGTSIGGLGHGQVYYAVATSATSIQLAVTANDAVNGNVIPLSPYAATGSTHGFGRAFRATPLVDGPTDRIQFQKSHPFQVGQQVGYSSGSGVAIGGLQNGGTYYVVGTTRDSLQLSATPGGPAIPLDPTVATGTEHSVGTLASVGSVVSGGDGAVIANNQGEIISITVAGTVITKAPEKPDANLLVAGRVDRNGNNGGIVARKSSFSESSDSGVDISDYVTPQGPPVVDDVAPAEPPRRSIAIAGTAAVNVIRGRTRAVISDSNVTFKGLDVLASDTSNSFLIAGSLAIATGSADSKGIAGAFVANVINNDTDARIERSKVIVTGGDVFVDAENDSRVLTIAMGGSGASKLAAAGSVAVNVVGSEARAKIVDQTEITAMADANVAGSGRVSVSAKDATTVTSIAGAGGIAAGAVARDRWGIGAAISLIVIAQREGTLAIVEDSDITADEQVTIKSKNDNQVTGVTAAIAAAIGGVSTNTLAVAVSIGVVVVDTNTRASVRRKKNTGIDAKKGLDIDAEDDTHFITIAGGGALAGLGSGALTFGRAAGGSVTFNYLDQDVTADITDMPVTSTEGSVVVDARSKPVITSVAAGAAVGDDMAVQGSFAVGVIDTDTSAYITNASSTILADGNVAVMAEDRAKIVTVAGSVSVASLDAGSNEPIASVGIANGTVVKLSTVDAFIDDDVTVQANGRRAATKVPTSNVTNKEFQKVDRYGVAVAAVSNATITNVAAGAAITGVSASTSIAGSATVTIIDDKTRARIGDRARINLDPTQVASGATESLLQSVTVVGANRTKLDGVAGAAGISFGKGGIGAGVDVAFVTKNTDARIEANADVEAQADVIVDAFSQENILSVSASIGIGKSAGVAFGVGVSIYDVTTKANVGASTEIEASGSVVVTADDQFVHELGSGSAGIGAQTVGGAGSFGIPIVTKVTTATIDSHAKIDALGQRAGLSVATGDFNAFKNQTLQDGELGQADLDYTHLPTNGDKSYFRDRKAEPATFTGFKGVSVTATSETAMEVYAVGAGGSSKVGIAASLAVAKADERTEAIIGTAAEINQKQGSPSNDQSVNVAAGNDLFMRIISGALGIGGQFAAAGGANVIFVDLDTKAEIGNGATVDAKKDITVRAFNEEDIIDVGLSAAGTVSGLALFGSAAVLDLNNTTNALIRDSATVKAEGNVAVHAEDRTDADLIAGAGGLALGGGSIGASIGVSLLSKDTVASIGASTVEALGNSNTFTIFNGKENNGNAATESIRGVGVSSYASEDVFMLSVAGSAGISVGIAGAINWQAFDSDTTAEIKSGARVNQAANNAAAAHANQDVYVVALNNLTSTSIAGALGLSVGIGVGGGVDVGTVDSSTLAQLGGDVTARRDVRVASTADRFVRSIAAAGNASFVGVAGGISRWTIGGDLGSNYSVGGETANPLSGYNTDGTDSGNTVSSDTEAQLDNVMQTDSGYSSNSSKNSGDNTRMAGQGLDRGFSIFGVFASRLTTFHSSQTRALVLPSANVIAGDDVEVEARDDNDIKLSGGGVNVSAVGAGAGIAILDNTTPVEASIGQNATISAIDKVDVRATSDESLRAIAIAGSGVLLGGAGAYGQVVEAGARSASLRSGVNIVSANSVDIVSHHRADFLAQSGSGALGIGVIGLSGANVSSAAKVEAFTQDVTIGSDANRVGNINISATSDIDNNKSEGRMAHAVGVAAGAVTATGVDSRATVNPEVAASIGAFSNVHSNGSVSVIGSADHEAKAAALGADVGAFSFGATFSTSTIDPNVKAVIGDQTLVRGADVEVQSLFNVSRGGATSASRSEAIATSGRGGIVTFSGSTALAEAKGSASTTIGSGAHLQSTTTDVVIKSHTFNNTYADGDGLVLAVVGIGDVNAKSVVDTLSQVTIGGGTRIDSKNNLTIAALSNERVDSKGLAGDRGLVPISKADGIVDVSNNTNVLITNGVDLDAFNTLSVIAEVDHWSRSEGTFDAQGFSFGNNIRVKADTTVNTTVDVNVFSADLTAQDVDIVARVKNLDAKARGDARGPVGLAADVSATADVTSRTKTDVDLLGSTILGRNSIDILSEHPLIKTFADTYALSPSAIGRLDTIAQNVTTIASNIVANSAATLTTKSLIVRANVPASRSILETSVRKRKGDGRGTDEPDAPTENISREIDFNAAINVAETGPVLVIDANGVGTTKARRHRLRR